jgi:hypothetical protein
VGGQEQGDRSARLGAEALLRRQPVIFEPMVWTMRQPPISVPSAMAVWQAITTQNGTWNSPVSWPRE